jgi:pilus assembly protein CpaE
MTKQILPSRWTGKPYSRFIRKNNGAEGIMMNGTVLIIDRIEENGLKERVEKLSNLSIIGNTNNLDIGFTLAEKHQPDVILLNVDLTESENDSIPEVFALEFPASSLILMTPSDSKRVLRQALRVGAKDVIVLPIEDDKLLHILGRTLQHTVERRNIYTVEKIERPQFKTITVFSTKGGVGKSTIALNLAITMKRLTQKRVVLVDLNLASGNIGLMAGISSKHSIKDLIDEGTNLDEQMLEAYCAEHSSGLRILGAPLNPETASFIKTEHVARVLDLLSHSFNYVIVDAPNYFHDTVFPALDRSRDIVIVTTMDMASIQNLKQCLDLLTRLSIRTKARVVVNKMGYTGGLKVKDLEQELGLPVYTVIPNCEKQAINAVNLGIPLLLSEKSSPALRPFEEMAGKLMNMNDHPHPTAGRRGIFPLR